MTKKILSLNDILENKIRKEKELEFYRKELEKIQQKMAYLQTDLDLTEMIIEMIETESIRDMRPKYPILGTPKNVDK